MVGPGRRLDRVPDAVPGRALQAGRFVADLAYVADEDANRYTRVRREELDPPPPEGYDYDVINAEAVVNRLSIDPSVPSRMVLPDGVSYRVLALLERSAISHALLRKVRYFLCRRAQSS